jgi:hypothetical protein
MATKKTTHKKKTIPQIPEHIELVAGESGIGGALTLLDNMSAMLDVMCSIDPEGEPIDSAQLAKVFFILHSWTNFAREQMTAYYEQKTTAA